MKRGYEAQARDAADQGYKESGDFPDLNWEYRVLLAEIDNRQGRPEEALELLVPDPPQNISQQLAWKRVVQQGYAFCQLRNAAETERHFRLAEQLPLFKQESDLPAELTLFRGLCELAAGNTEGAEALFRLVDHSEHADPFTEAYAVRGIGWCALKARNYEDAVAFYDRSQKASSVLQAIPFEERAMGNMGVAYFELGDFAKALNSSKSAEQLAEKLGLAHDQVHWVLDVGRAYDATGQSGLAQEYYTKALTLARQLEDHEIQARALHDLIAIELFQGKLSNAEQHQRDAGRLKLTGEDLLQFDRDEAGIAAAKHDWPKAERLLLSVLPEAKNSPRLTWMVEGDLARLYAGQGRGSEADKWFRKSIDAMQSAATAMKGVEFKIAMLGSWPIFDDYIAFLYSRNERERALQIAQLARARNLAEELGFKAQNEDARVWLRRLQALLRAKASVLLAFYEAERETFVWVVTGKDLQMVKVAATQNEIETLADAYRTEIDQHVTIDSSPAQQKLHQLLIKPVAKFIPHGSHVILVADSALYRINFETLICEEGQPHYWIDDVEIENASSIDLLLNAKHESHQSKGALVIGAPAQADSQYPLLPEAHQEVDKVKEQFADGAAKVFESSSATPEAYLKSSPSSYKYIEFATHSEASSSDPMQSAIILSKDAAGAFRLTAKQIVELKPKLNADLVTISGCYSSGKIGTSAEGLLGLQWAFQRAGAHQVVAGLWDVDDKSSPALMGGLYAGVVKERKSAAQALRDAKLKMIHSGKFPPAPYYWAALQLYTGS